MLDFYRSFHSYAHGAKSRKRNKTESLIKKSRPTFTHFNFGLDVVPNLMVDVPDHTLVKMICVPMYILAMAFWFPVLPVIQ